MWRDRRWLLSLLFSKRCREQMVHDTYYCLRHYPFDCHINDRWANDVCDICDESKQWCVCDKKKESE
jgi:hypothetical protein